MMIRPIITLRRRRVLIDVDTQKDFLTEQGTCCIRNHRRVLANIRRMMAWARKNNIRTISTCRIHESSNGNISCIAGTPGQHKVSYTLRENRRIFPADGSTDLPREIFREYDQVILHKRCINPYDEPRADRMLSEIRADEFVIIGSVAEEGVKYTALGLLVRERNVTIISDAVGSLDKHAGEIAFRQMEAKGAKIIDSRAYAGSTHLRLVGACGCARCMGEMTQNQIRATG